MNKELEWVSYLIGKIKADQVQHPDNLAKLEGKNEQKREHQLMALGYNQAMLDHAQFPVGDLERDAVESIVERLREDLGK